MNITTHLILRPPTTFLRQSLESLVPLRGKILVADLGADREALGVCETYRATVKQYPWRHSLAEVRNRMVEDSVTEWNLYVEPWEAIVEGVECIREPGEGPRAYRMSILAGESIRKEVRLWHRATGCRFVNPVYESLDVAQADPLPAVIWENKVDRTRETAELLAVWEKTDPFSQDMKYFRALQALAAGDRQGFSRLAQQYLFRQTTKPVAYSMISYYLGVVNCVRSDLGAATRNAVACIAANPLMAEYWCLLGDIFVKANDPARAECFYANAKILGARRLSDDPWPMHMPKYDEYPTSMIEKCRELRKPS